MFQVKLLSEMRIDSSASAAASASSSAFLRSLPRSCTGSILFILVAGRRGASSPLSSSEPPSMLAALTFATDALPRRRWLLLISCGPAEADFEDSADSFSGTGDAPPEGMLLKRRPDARLAGSSASSKGLLGIARRPEDGAAGTPLRRSDSLRFPPREPPSLVLLRLTVLTVPLPLRSRPPALPLCGGSAVSPPTAPDKDESPAGSAYMLYGFLESATEALLVLVIVGGAMEEYRSLPAGLGSSLLAGSEAKEAYTLLPGASPDMKAAYMSVSSTSAAAASAAAAAAVAAARRDMTAAASSSVVAVSRRDPMKTSAEWCGVNSPLRVVMLDLPGDPGWAAAADLLCLRGSVCAPREACLFRPPCTACRAADFLGLSAASGM
mmetsp:Transcript_375/g.1097  ORF Transcript_375/g.1097 Transcript_375/m.1097 type:complete len:381 (+) Transcript_375:951-2093(+)